MALTVEQLQGAEQQGEYLKSMIQQAIDALEQVMAWAKDHNSGQAHHTEVALQELQVALAAAQANYDSIHGQLAYERAEAEMAAQNGAAESEGSQSESESGN